MDDALEVIGRAFGQAGLHAALGMELVSLDANGCRVRVLLDERHLNLARSVHGGVVASLVDTAIGLAFVPTLVPPAGMATPTTSLTVELVAPIRAGARELVATARVIRAGKHTGFGEAEVVCDGALVAKALGTVAMVPFRSG